MGVHEKWGEGNKSGGTGATRLRERGGEKKQVVKTRHNDMPMGVGDAVLTLSERGRGD
jgi:hypothetical protein